jgi:hypothetical protein
VGKLVEFFNKIKEWLMFLHRFVTVATPLVLPLLTVATAVAILQWSH